MEPGAEEPSWLMKVFKEYHNSSVILLHYNYTGKLQNNKYKGGLKAEAIVFLIICVMIILENLMVLIAIWKNKKFHSPMYYLLGNLTLSDLLAGVAYAVNITLSGANTLKLTPASWFVREGGVFITLAASVLSLLAIAIERHITMAHLKLNPRDNKGRMLWFIGATWLVSMLLGILPIMGWNCLLSLPECSTVLPLYSKNYILFSVTVFLIILVSIAALYVRIYSGVRSNTQALKMLRGSMLKKSQKNMALLKTVTIVLGVFMACWLPLFILLLVDVACEVGAYKFLYKADYFLGLAMLNSLLNPIIYTLTNKDMKRTVWKLLCPYFLVHKNRKNRRFRIRALECTASMSEKLSQKLEGQDTPMSSGITTPISKTLVLKTPDHL
ncbi:sphingosine 1-phosphate receptor 5a [Latimeria chalumnae]|uniref:sphingosine 1-phosphate receptor 5a n=1 Tax=Latimeria chalumnae TaxID=7897 RepID=UPI0003C15C65|nr:PREDICTED: sphingosine 1-phosphate receptor 1-like [Latimeria chalumnae]|eukprot:XP_005997536.1 PREDICTED: sphingosine 1-phosphate receptor 1-like [Latimeria chalumnae]